MLQYESGIFGLPLRLLAREVYDKCVKKLVARKSSVNYRRRKNYSKVVLIILFVRLKMPKDKIVDFIAIDEIQMCADRERGHIFTDRLLNMRGEKITMFLDPK